jgi:PAS domain S-box-containing protein
LSPSQVGIWSLDLETGSTAWSEEIYNIYALPLDTPTTLSQELGFYDEHDQEKINNLIEAVSKTHKPQFGMFSIRDFSGTQKRVQIQIFPALTNPKGEVWLIQGTISECGSTASASIEQSIENRLLEHAIVARTNSRGLIVEVNDKFCEISGFSRLELIGRDHRIVNSGKHDKAFMKNIWQTIKSGKIWQGEICNRNKQGYLYWVNTTIVPNYSKNGHIESFTAFRHDVTQKKLVEAVSNLATMLRRSHQEYRRIPNAYLSLVLDSTLALTESTSGFLLTMNSTSVATTGSIFESLSQESLISITQSWLLDGSLSNRGMMLQSPELVSNTKLSGVEERHQMIRHAALMPLRYDGLQIGIMVLMDAPAPYTMNQLTDLAPLVESVAETIAYQELYGIQSRLGLYADLIFAQINVGTWNYNATNGDINLARNFTNMFGLDASPEPNSTKLLEKVDRNQQPLLEQVLRAEVATARLAFNVAGQRKHFSFKSRVVTNHMGMQEVIGIAVDVTEEVETTKALEAEKSISLKQSNLATLGELTASIGHEINNPLTLTMGHLELLKSDLKQHGQLTPIVTEHIEHIKTGMHDVLNIVADIRSVTMNLQREQEPFAPDELIKKSVSLVDRIYRKSGVMIHIHLSGSCELVGPPGAMQQIMMNLLTNSFQAMAGRGHIVIHSYIDSGEYHLEVTDTGPGVAREIEDKIFDMFFSSQTGSSNTGIGLAKARRLAEDMDGTLKLLSHAPNSAMFRLSLPIIKR